MKKTFGIVLSSIMIVAALGGCSKKGVSSPAAPAADRPTSPQPATREEPTTLTMTGWCTFVQDDAGTQYQERVRLQTDGKATLTYFSLNADSSRGAALEETEATWKLDGETLSFTSDGQTQTFQIRLDPTSETGAPRLHVTDANGAQAAYDPCE